MSLPSLLKSSLRLPIIGAPLFIVSTPELVLAQCKSGIVGSFPALNARPPEFLETWLEGINSELTSFREANPGHRIPDFAVNQICHSSNDRLQRDFELCVKHKVRIIITSLMPPKELIDETHAYGGVVFHDVTTMRHARRAIRDGVDGLILVCAGAGGHAGRLNPFAFIQEVRAEFGGTIGLAGAMSNGADVLAALALGADFAYMGTRFIPTQEANAHADYKQQILASNAEDIIYTDLFSGVPANYLLRSVVDAGFDPNDLPTSNKSKMNFGSESDVHKKVWRDIWSAGQGVGSISKLRSIAETVDILEREFWAARSHEAQRLQLYEPRNGHDDTWAEPNHV